MPARDAARAVPRRPGSGGGDLVTRRRDSGSQSAGRRCPRPSRRALTPASDASRTSEQSANSDALGRVRIQALAVARNFCELGNTKLLRESMHYGRLSTIGNWGAEVNKETTDTRLDRQPSLRED